MRHILLNLNVALQSLLTITFGIHKATLGTNESEVHRLIALHLLHRPKVNVIFLRLLLARVASPCSFADLLTADGHKCSTFHESALKHGIIEPDDWIDRCLDDTVAVQMPHALRRLFATILVFLEPSNPAQMWDRYYVHLSEDYAVKHPCQPHRILALTCQSLASFFGEHGKES